ncbi:uncharacterized protein [Arachis hypogaea]|uniref:uncharacterized protein n=1 Tax=Arachis hypogaea TaxID=3818 RepID=UPI003B20E0F9
MASSITMEHVESQRGRDTILSQWGGKKVRSSSEPRGKDSNFLEERVSMLENVLSSMDERFQRIEHDKETLEAHVLGELDAFKESMLQIEEKLENSLKLFEEVRVWFEEAKSRPTIIRETTKIDLPKPKEFKGVRDAREVENFLWQMERYFEGQGVVEEAIKVRTAALYLSDNATLWWRRKCVDMEKGTCNIATWEDFKRELKRQFFPENVVYEARKKLRELKHKSTISDYVKEFTTLTLQIPNLASEDALFFFIDGLQPWAKQELQRRNVKDVDEAIVVAESLTEYHRGDSKPKSSSKSSSAKGGGDKGKSFSTKKEGKYSSKKEYEEKKKAFVPKGGCFVCKGPHQMKDCPKLGTLASIAEEREAQTQVTECVGSIQHINAVKTKEASTAEKKGLIYVKAFINEKPVMAMIDTGATHNFITPDEARRLGLKITEKNGWFKPVNTKGEPLKGVAKRVEMTLGSWKGLVDFSVAPMDDFKIVIGLDLQRKANIIPMPYYNIVCVMEKGSPCMVPTISKAGGIPMLSTMQLKKGFKKGETTYLALLQEESISKREDVPPKIKEVIEENKDVMPPELPKQLPPRRKMDDNIELELGAKPPISKPYRMSAISMVEGDIMHIIKEGLHHDPLAKKLVELAREGKTKRFWLENDLLYTKGRRLYVPKWENLRRKLVRECHDTKWAGHQGQRRTLALIESSYYWPQMRAEVESYVKTCLVCQQDKIENKTPSGLLEPLPPSERPWESVSLDFISALPKSEGFGSILVVVDRFSKYATFISAPTDCTAEEAARLFFKNVVKYWGLPKSIISDRDPRFTGRLWTELFKLLGSELHFSTSFHPQTDGQTERVNALLECYLRHFVSANQKDWTKLLDIAQFSYNLQRSESTGKSPFEIVTGQQPLTPHSLSSSYSGKSPGAYHMIKSWEEQADVTRSYLDKAAKRMKKWADKKRRHASYQVGDKVMIKLLPQQFKAFRKVHKGLIRKYEGPFEIIGRVGEVAYKVQLPPSMKIHPVFHVSMLKPYHADQDEPSRGNSSRAPPVVIRSFDKEIEEILANRVVRRRGVPPSIQYLIKWKGLPITEASWETRENLWQFQEHLERYHEQNATRTSAH